MSSASKSTAFYVRDAADYRPATFEELLAGAKRALSEKFTRGCTLSSPEDMRNYLRCAFGPRQAECFVLILLDARSRLLACLEMFRGTVHEATVYPREVVKKALQYNATSAIVAHNHPSGVAEPSQADELMTRRLKDALTLIDIKLLDHLVVAGDDICSFSERGLL